MELQIVFAFLTSFFIVISSHPKNPDIIPKEYYKRQILQPIPGYIPVYIKADGEPLVRRESKKPVINVHPQKAAEFEKNFSKHADKKIALENNDEKSGAKTEGDEIKNSKDVSTKLQEKPESEKKPNENTAEVGFSQGRADAHRIQTAS